MAKGLGIYIILTFKNFKSSKAKEVFIKVKSFTSVLISIEVLILYSLRDNIHKTVKYLPFIN